jgi:hypothetical protein
MGSTQSVSARKHGPKKLWPWPSTHPCSPPIPSTIHPTAVFSHIWSYTLKADESLAFSHFISQSYIYRKRYILNPPKSDWERVLMMRRLVRIRTKFQYHNPAVLWLHIRNGAVENIRVVPPKFWPDPNQTSRHKHTLSDTPRLFKKGQFWIYTSHMRSAYETCRFKTGDA